MLATQVPTLMRWVASPISCAVATESLLTSAQNTASKPACSACCATLRISAARHPAPGINPRPNRSGISSSRPGLIRDWFAVASHSTPPGSLRRQPQEAAGQHEVGLVDHLAVERESAGIGSGGEGGDDLLGPFALGGAH